MVLIPLKPRRASDQPEYDSLDKQCDRPEGEYHQSEDVMRFCQKIDQWVGR